MIPNPWLLLGAAVAWALSLLGTYHFAATNTANADKAAQVKAIAVRDTQQAALEKELAATDETNRANAAGLLAALEHARDNVQTKTITLIKEVPKYVTVKADAACTVPNGFVRLHDAAARGNTVDEDSGPPDASDDKPSGVALSQVGSVLTENYAGRHVAEAELQACAKYIDLVKQFHESIQRGFRLCPVQ